ncbi:hypothetical protein PGIGA_G00155970 [Pangasianodon gigas]|uniref:Uncharacterized protein n=1 Tax=Pangasianodon gigas TaxID=30993 RepID=A0ACC5XQ56_PANGG|nr:hypothetical protein [Pangasianodon gigas]
MEEYIQNSLPLRFLLPATSPAGVGFFFVEKKGGHVYWVKEFLKVLLPSLSNIPSRDSPKNTIAEVLSSGETVEGDTVTMSCSSDANPPVLTYSWFKQRTDADTLLTTGQNYSISNISSQHSGLYYCTAHNQLGQHNSLPTFLDVLYSPKNTSAVVLSSGDTVEGDSVTLSCSSDANPPVLTYSWFKQRTPVDTLLTTGQNYSISNISSQHSGLYYCTAHNQLGQHNSTPAHLNVLHPPRIPSVTVVPSVSGDLVTLLCTSDSNPISSYTWRRASAFSNRSEEYRRNDSAPVYGNVSATTSDPRQTASSEDQDNVQYSSVYFRHSHVQEVPLYSTVQLPNALSQEEEVEYATVSLVKSRAVR